MIRLQRDGQRRLAMKGAWRTYSWGSTSNGTLGHDDIDHGRPASSCQAASPQSYPREMVGLRGQQIRAITSSEHFSLAVTETGELYSWGYADFGRLGHGNMPLPLDGEQWRSGEVAALPYLLAPDGISPWIPTPTQVMALAGEHVVCLHLSPHRCLTHCSVSQPTDLSS